MEGRSAPSVRTQAGERSGWGLLSGVLHTIRWGRECEHPPLTPSEASGLGGLADLGKGLTPSHVDGRS